MSYVLQIWESPLLRSFDEAERFVSQEGEKDAEQNQLFLKLAKQLTAQYPCITKLEDSDDAVWSDGPLDGVTDSKIYVLGIASDIPEVQPFVVATANFLGLTVFDMQVGKAYLPSGEILSGKLQGHNSIDGNMTKATVTSPEMKVSDVRDNVAMYIADVLIPHGFKIKKASDGVTCERKINGGKQTILFVWANYRPLYRISACVIFRFDEMAKIDIEISGIERKYWADVTSSVSRISYFTGVEDIKYEVTTSEQIREVIENLKPTLLERVVPFLDKCSDLKTFERVLNERPSRGFDYTHLPGGAIHSVIAAKLMGNPEFENLVSDGWRSMEKYHDMYKQRFGQCVDFLRNDGDIKKTIE